MEELESHVVGIFEGTILEGGYGHVPREIMRDSTISKGAKNIYCYLMSFAGDKFIAFPKVATVCRELGFGNQGTYYKYLNELKSLGLVRTELIKVNGKFSKNMFYITLRKTEIKKLKIKVKKEHKTKNLIDKPVNKPYFKKCSMVKKSYKPYFTFRYTQNESTEKRSTNINRFNINRFNTDVVEEAFSKTYESYGKCKDISKPVSIAEKEILKDMVNAHTEDLVLKAITIMVDHDTVNLKYVRSVLEKWKEKGLTTLTDIETSLAEDKVLSNKVTEKKRNNLKAIANGTNYTGKTKQGSFNDYEQRDYDFDKLEKGLLGWDNKENDSPKE